MGQADIALHGGVAVPQGQFVCIPHIQRFGRYMAQGSSLCRCRWMQYQYGYFIFLGARAIEHDVVVGEQIFCIPMAAAPYMTGQHLLNIPPPHLAGDTVVAPLGNAAGHRHQAKGIVYH